MARRKTPQQIGEQTMRMLTANNEIANRGGINRQARILRANAKYLIPHYKKAGNKNAVKALQARLGAVSG